MAALRASWHWLGSAVAGRGGALFGRALCPFAAGPLRRRGVRLVLCGGNCPEQLLCSLRRELDALFHEDPAEQLASPETTLVVTPALFCNDYRAMVHFSWRIMQHISDNKHLVERVQVVNFHPQALHSLYSSNQHGDGSEYTIRSPFPTFHLLRESDVLEAVQSSGYPNPELIPSRNAASLRKLGSAEAERLFHTLY